MTKWSFPYFSPSVWKNWWLQCVLSILSRQTTEYWNLNVCEDKGLSCNNPTVPLSGCPPSCFSRQPFLMSTQPVNLSVTWHVAIYTHETMFMHPVLQASAVKLISTTVWWSPEEMFKFRSSQSNDYKLAPSEIVTHNEMVAPFYLVPYGFSHTFTRVIIC